MSEVDMGTEENGRPANLGDIGKVYSKLDALRKDIQALAVTCAGCRTELHTKVDSLESSRRSAKTVAFGMLAAVVLGALGAIANHVFQGGS